MRSLQEGIWNYKFATSIGNGSRAADLLTQILLQILLTPTTTPFSPSGIIFWHARGKYGIETEGGFPSQFFKVDSVAKIEEGV